MIQPVSLPVLKPFTERTTDTVSSDEIDDDESTGMLGGDGEGGSIKPFSDVIDILPQNRLEIELKKVFMCIYYYQECINELIRSCYYMYMYVQ